MQLLKGFVESFDAIFSLYLHSTYEMGSVVVDYSLTGEEIGIE
jgi:hypothetical protein